MESRIEQLKTKLVADNEIISLKILEEYEPSINSFFDELDSEGFVSKGYSQTLSNRLKKFIRVANEAVQLGNIFHNMYSNKSPNEIKNKDYIFEKLGFKTDIYHYFISVCNGYQVMSELLKKHLILVIDLDAMGYENAFSRPLGPLVGHLQCNFSGKEGKFTKNIFVDSLSSKIRNSIAHYTYYLEDYQIHFCKNIHDNDPIKLSLEEFRIECNKLNILTQVLFLIYLDKYHPGGKLLLNNF
jgi:hypothetical protein